MADASQKQEVLTALAETAAGDARLGPGFCKPQIRKAYNGKCRYSACQCAATMELAGDHYCRSIQILEHHPLHFLDHGVHSEYRIAPHIEHHRGVRVAPKGLLLIRLVQIYDEPGHQYRRESALESQVVSVT